MMKRVVKLTNRPVGVGARYATEFVGAPPMVMECIRYERPSGWSTKGDSRALKAIGDGRVVPTSRGAHLVMRMELEPRGLLKLAAPLLRRRMKLMWQTDLDNIKARLEEPRTRGGRSDTATTTPPISMRSGCCGSSWLMSRRSFMRPARLPKVLALAGRL